MDQWIRQRKAAINEHFDVVDLERRNTDDYTQEMEKKVKEFGEEKMLMTPLEYFSYPDNRRLRAIDARIAREGVEENHGGWYTYDVVDEGNNSSDGDM